MTLEKLGAKDARVLLVWILAGLIGAGVAYKYFFRAFPEASVEFKVPRGEALNKARGFAAAEGAQLDGYDSTIVFDLDETAKTYLEREVGLDRANRMMRDDLHIWYWQTRFFRPLQKEEFDVRVDPAGKIVGYSHVLEDTAPGVHLDRAAAQSSAERFLRDTLHLDLSAYEFREEEANSTEKPNRRDWSFSWERRGFLAKDAPYRLRVTLAGDGISGYDEFLKVPEAWERAYGRLRESNNLLEYFAFIPYAFLVGGCLYVIISLGRQGFLHWRAGLLLGLFLAGLYFLMMLNQWPLDRAGYDTNTPYSTFFLSHVGQAVIVSALTALLVVIAFVPGEPFYRVTQPDKLRLTLGLRLPTLRSREFFRANVIGICMAAAHIGYITVFYIVSRKLGAWAPQDLSYENVLSTRLPWVYPLTIGIYAATSEEFLFRLFAIPYLHRLTRSKLLAVILPAFFWGFLHSNYPQEPAYIRGIEVGLIGIVAGIVMLRWGIWATLTWHYTVDAFLISTSLLGSPDAYLRISGAIVGGGVLIPLGIAAFYYLSRGGFEVDPTLLNRALDVGRQQGTPEEAEPAEAPPEEKPESTAALASNGYTAMSSRALITLAVCAVIGLGILAAAKTETIGDFVRFQIGAKEAVARGDQALRSIKVDAASYQHAATIAYTFDSYANEYLRRALGIAAVNRIYREEVPSAFWTVRYFRDSQNEEYLAVLKPDGSLHSVHHTLDEKAPGANLSKEEALARAEVFLRNEKKMDLSGWNLVDSRSDKKPARTDHFFEWEQKAVLDPDSGQQGAHIRVQLHVQGDEVSGYRIFIKIPELWQDRESRRTSAQLAQTFGRVVCIAAIVISILIIFLSNLRRPEVTRVPWRQLAKWSLGMLAAAVIISVNRWPALLAGYSTVTPMKMFFAMHGIAQFFSVSLDFAVTILLLGLGWFFLERAFGQGCVPSWNGMSASYYRDAFFVALFGSVAVVGLDHLPDLFARWPILQHTLDASVPQGLDLLSPSAGAIASAVANGFRSLGLISILAGVIGSYVRPLWARAGLIVLYAVLSAANVVTLGGLLREGAVSLITVSVLAIAVAYIVRFNMLGYFTLTAVTALTPSALDLLSQPNASFHIGGIVVAAMGIAFLAWPFVLWRRAAAP